MNDDLLPVLVAALGTACFACFTWGTLHHFVRKHREWGGTWAISLLSLSGLGIFLWQVLSRPISSGWVVACILFGGSTGLWGWALATTRVTPPTLAFTGDEPRLLLDAGPYRWVRHPFYTAYLLFWTGTAVATQGILGWAAVLILGAVYFVAARHEEGKFARSALAARYADYTARTSMFLPWPKSLHGAGRFGRRGYSDGHGLDIAAADISDHRGQVPRLSMQMTTRRFRRPVTNGKERLASVTRLFQLASSVVRSFLLTGLSRRVADRIRLEQINALSTLAGVMAVMGQGTILLVAHEFWDTRARTLLAPVEGIIFLSYVILIGLGLRWNGLWIRQTDKTADQVRSRYVQVISVLGLAWGVLFVGLMPLAQGNTRSLLYALVVGLVSAGALIVPVSAALAFWIPITAAGFIATAITPDGFDIAGFVLLGGYSVLTLFCMLYLNRLLIRRALGEIEQLEGRETIGLLLRDFEDASSDWLWETDEGGLLTHVSDRFARATQRNPDSLFGMTFAEIVGSSQPFPLVDRSPSVTAMPSLAALMERRLPFRDFEVCLQVEAEIVWWSLTGKPKFTAQQVFEGYRGVGSDVTYVKRMNDRARYLAQYDELTGLANRRLFRETLDAQFQASGAASIALLCLDLDRFKAVNDTWGHPTGDMLLVAVAQRLEGQVRTGDLCARLGGDEFAIVLAVADAALARVIAARLVVELSQPYVIDGNQLEIGVSIGIAMGLPGTTSYDALLKDADAALYRAKAKGRGIACFHSLLSGDPD